MTNVAAWLVCQLALEPISTTGICTALSKVECNVHMYCTLLQEHNETRVTILLELDRAGTGSLPVHRTICAVANTRK